MLKFTIGILLLIFSGRAAMACEAVASPDQRIRVEFCLRDGNPGYAVAVDARPLLEWSGLGFTLQNEPALATNFAVANVQRATHDETWEQPWGEQRFIRDHYNELRVSLVEQTTPSRQMDVVFRVFDEGVAFRYEIPAQIHLSNFTIMKELTEFNFVRDHNAWWIPGLVPNHYEHLFRFTPLSQIPFVHTPITIHANNGLVVAIHEANVTDFATFVLRNTGGGHLQTELVPWADGTAVKTAAPVNSPWRTMQIAHGPSGLVNNFMILNLNEPNKIADTSWIKPQKMLGVWWGMHLGLWTWGSGPTHGATTENVRRYIDYAAALKIPSVLVEGWNLGWDSEWGPNFSFTESYPDFDLPGLVAYGKSKGVELVGHHETGGYITNYENQMEDAFKLYQSLGVHAVKTGYVADLVQGGEYHGGQYMVRHYRKVAELASRYQIMVDAHEPVKDTGVRRTLPNFMTREGARGMEYAAWGGPNGFPAEHTVILPYTRMLGGPFDITPGIFDLLRGKTSQDQIKTTLAKQLALYVVIYSPIHMAADLPENYVGHPAFKFIQDVPTDWSRSIGVNGVIGDYSTIARKDRASGDWYLGSITDEFARTISVRLDFLDVGKTYCAEIYRDADDTDYLTNPTTYEIERREVTSASTLQLKLARGGGQAIRFKADCSL